MKEQLEDIKIIREMMEKSTKFLSLSGLSGAIAGLTATAGAAFAYFYLLRDPSLTDFNRMQEIMILLADALVVLTISIACGLFFSWRKAKKNNQRLWNRAGLNILYNMAVPLVVGGLFSLVFLLRGNIEVVISSTLVFYGVALLNASKYTYNEIHYLGITEIIIGLLAAIFIHNGIIFWTLGFGICHILYGLIMYFKYDRRKA
jgi:uncharacterized membrane protein YidH (DUF202 family)